MKINPASFKDVLTRWTEKHLRTDVRYLASGGFWLAAGQAGAAVAALGFSIIVARYLPPEIYGSYKYLLSLAAIVGALSLSGLATVVLRSIATGSEGTLRYAVGRMIAWSGPMLLVFAAISGWYAYNGNFEFAGAVLVAGLATPFINASSLAMSYWNGRKDFRSYMVYWTSVNTVTAVATAVTILFTDSIFTIIGVYFVSNAFTNVVVYLITVRRVPESASIDKKDLPYAFHLSGINIFNTVSGHADKILVFQLLGTVELAIYSFAIAIPDQIRAFLKGGSRLALPRYAERTFESIVPGLGAKMFRFGVVITVGALIYVLLAPYIFSFLFPTYLSAVPYSQVIALSLFTVLGTAPLAAMQAHAKTVQLYTYSIIANVTQIASSIGFILILGLWGAVIALLLNRTIALILPLYLLKSSGDKLERN